MKIETILASFDVIFSSRILLRRLSVLSLIFEDTWQLFCLDLWDACVSVFEICYPTVVYIRSRHQLITKKSIHFTPPLCLTSSMSWFAHNHRYLLTTRNMIFRRHFSVWRYGKLRYDLELQNVITPICFTFLSTHFIDTHIELRNWRENCCCCFFVLKHFVGFSVVPIL